MKLFVSSLVLSLCITFLPAAPDTGRVKCTCRPSPPGGITECQSGQIAVCRAGGGVCRGSCISVNANLQPLPYSAELLAKVLDKNVSVGDLTKDQQAARKNLEALVRSSQRDEPVKLMYQGQEYVASVGLTEAAVKKLKAALVLIGVNNRPRVKVGLGYVQTAF